MGPVVPDLSEFRTGDEFGNDLGVNHWGNCENKRLYKWALHFWKDV
jgi:hypothetical protein